MARTRSWEARCRRCGRCCYEKIEFEGEVYYTDIPCEMLDPQTRLCRVYAARQTVRPGCVPLTPRLVRRGLLPPDCPYVADLADYRPPHLGDEEGVENSGFQAEQKGPDGRRTKT
jgi:uncharacterized cysteine cluster protein YcgN (CxxCxxCC family)